ncbi:MAG: hypothetical protein AAGJ40_22850 [Planctomycetota bacterium]
MLIRRIHEPTALARQCDVIARIRCGRIVMRSGVLDRIESHWMRHPVSVAQVWWQQHFARDEGDQCMLDFHIPRGMPRFITLDYIRSGRGTSYRTFLGACRVLDEVARRRSSLAIVAHLTNQQLSDRLMTRLGWHRHMPHWPGRHFIRRFYDGHPDPKIDRYLTPVMD